MVHEKCLFVQAPFRLFLGVRTGRCAVAAPTCPHCKAEITAANVVAYSNGVDCPKCGTRLEVASGARTISTLCGLAAGVIVWRLATGSGGDLGAVLPILY